MKRTVRLFSILLVAAILITAMPLVGSAGSEALADKTIVTFGDSLTKLGTASGTMHYSDYLASDAYLGVPIINAGVGGDSTRHGMARFETDVLSKNPELVIICFGMNDQAALTASYTPNVPIETYRYNLSYFVEKLHAIGSDVVFLTPNPVLVGEGYYTPGGYGLDYSYGFLDDFCNVMREVAIEYNCTLVDINYECEFEDLYDFISDGIHQTTYGKQQYAKYISEHLLAVYDGIGKATMTVNCVDEDGNILETVTHVGKEGANIILASPEIYGYTTDDEDIKASFTDGATYTYTYSLKLESLVAQAESLSANGYSEVIIDKIRAAVAEGRELLASEDSDIADIFACTDRLDELLSVSGKSRLVVSGGADCSIAALTDGVKGVTDGGAESYTGWSNAETAEITVDLGTATEVNYFSIYCASGQNNASKPAKLTVSISENGSEFTEVASQTGVKTVTNTDKWDTTVMTAVTEAPVSARYIRYTVTASNTLLLIDEVEAALSVEPIGNAVGIDSLNALPEEGQIAVFTQNSKLESIGDGYYGVLAGKDGGAYKVLGISSTLESISVPSDEILLVANGSDTLIAALREGDTFTLSEVDTEAGKLGIMPYAKLDIEISDGGTEGDTLWLTHYNSVTPEGAGVIFTNTYSGCGWWYHVAFAPVEGLKGVYEIVAKADGTSDGKALPLDVPVGGFVYAVNTGNDYITINKDPEAVNYKNSGSAASISAAKKWKIGDRYVFGGLDLENKTVPTTTAHLDYFADGYVCTATIAKYVPSYALGDVNNNGEIEKYDYIAVKRAVLGTLTLNDIQQKAADVNGKDGVEKYDYILVKRHVLGTYKIEG